MKTTQKSLWINALALLVCFSMLVGTTFAWFTDSVTNTGNRIKAGKLLIDAYSYATDPAAASPGGLTVTIPGVNDDNDFTFVADTARVNLKTAPAGTSIINETLWEPGKTSAKLLKVVNMGTLAAKISLSFEVKKADLQGALWFDIIQLDDSGDPVKAFAAKPMNQLSSFAVSLDDAPLLANESLDFVLVYGMDKGAGNEFQEKEFEADISITANQYTYEEDGFGNSQYDVSAGSTVLPDGADVTTLKGAITAAAPGAVIELPSTFTSNETITIDKPITLIGNGATITSPATGSAFIAKASDIVLKDFVFENTANPVNQTASITMYNSGIVNLTVDGCVFNSGYRGINVNGTHTGLVIIENCEFNNGVRLNVDGYASKVVDTIVRNNTFTSLNQSQFTLAGVLDNVDIYENDFVNGAGIRLTYQVTAGAPPVTTYFTPTNVTVHDNTYMNPLGLFYVDAGFAGADPAANAIPGLTVSNNNLIP